MIKKLFLGLFLLTAIACVVVWTQRAPLLSNFLTAKLGSKVTIKEVHLGLHTFEARGITISDSNLHVDSKIDQLLVKGSLPKLLGNPVRIDAIQLSKVQLKSRFNGSPDSLIRKVKKITQKKEPTPSSSSSKPIEVTSLKALDVQLELEGPFGLGSLSFTTPNIHVKEFTTDLNTLVDHVVAKLLTQVKN